MATQRVTAASKASTASSIRRSLDRTVPLLTSPDATDLATSRVSVFPNRTLKLVENAKSIVWGAKIS